MVTSIQDFCLNHRYSLMNSPRSRSAFAPIVSLCYLVVHLSVLSLSLYGAPAGAVPVLPGLSGFGVDTSAGRGGAVLRVTNRADSGAGSLREALAAKGPRIVVFEVGGTIELAGDLYIRDPFVTVAGQTAPWPGITLKGAGLKIKTHDVLVQHLRVRVGDQPGGPDYDNRDGLAITGTSDGTLAVYNVVIDHCSISWATDEGVSTWYDNVRDVTIHASIISENLEDSYHPKGAHSNGLLIGDFSKRFTISRNLFAHNAERNPLMKGDTTVEIINNVIYNARNAHVHFADDAALPPGAATIVGNVFISGPDTNTWLSPVRVKDNVAQGTRLYLKDNLWWGASDDQWDLVDNATPYALDAFEPVVGSQVENALASNVVAEHVLQHSGARAGERDAVDARVVGEVRARDGRIIDSQAQVGGWPTQPERTRTLNVPVNPHDDPDGNGYTNIEEWLHEFAASVEAGVMPPPPEPPLDITTTTLPAASAGVFFEAFLKANRTSVSWQVIAGSLPPGLTLADDGRLFGMPAAHGRFAWRVRASADAQTTDADLSIDVLPGSDPPTITTTTLPDANVGVPYAYTLSAAGGEGELTWRLEGGALADGLSLNSDGVIAGVPEQAQLRTFTAAVYDERGQSATGSLTLSVRTSAPPSIEITPSELPDAYLRTSYWQQLEFLSDSEAVKWRITAGVLPKGIQLGRRTGTLFGFVRRRAQTQQFRVTVTDDTGQKTQRTYTLSVQSKPPVLSKNEF